MSLWFSLLRKSSVFAGISPTLMILQVHGILLVVLGCRVLFAYPARAAGFGARGVDRRDVQELHLDL